MSVKKEASGRRSVQAEAVVPGTPEQVWQAIATGPGVTSWFAPTEIEERAGGKLVFHMMPGMDSVATIIAWEPPRRFAVEDPNWLPGGPPVATEWTVEARAGGTCLVRVVHSLFASTDEWDNQLESTETGWPDFFRILRLYLSDYFGQRCSPMRMMGTVAGPEAEAWKKLSDALGLAGSTAGKRLTAPPGTPPLAGIVEQAAEAKDHHTLLVRLEQPGPGLVTIGSFDCGGMVMAMVSFYLYGDAAAAVAKRDEPLWQAWMSQHFPAANGASTAGSV